MPEIKDLSGLPWRTNISPYYMGPSSECLEFITANFYGKCLNIGTGEGFSVKAMIDSEAVTSVTTMDLIPEFNQLPQELIDSGIVSSVQYNPILEETFDCVFIDHFDDRIYAANHYFNKGCYVVIDDMIQQGIDIGLEYGLNIEIHQNSLRDFGVVI